MRIYVEGMKMPKNCDECILRHKCEISLRLSKQPFDCLFHQNWIDAKVPVVFQKVIFPKSYIERIE